MNLKQFCLCKLAFWWFTVLADYLLCTCGMIWWKTFDLKTSCQLAWPLLLSISRVGTIGDENNLIYKYMVESFIASKLILKKQLRFSFVSTDCAGILRDWPVKQMQMSRISCRNLLRVQSSRRGKQYWKYVGTDAVPNSVRVPVQNQTYK